MFNQSMYVINEGTQLIMLAVKRSQVSQVSVGITITVTNTTTTGIVFSARYTYVSYPLIPIMQQFTRVYHYISAFSQEFITLLYYELLI